MSKRKAIILSQNPKLSKQIEYELLLLGYDVNIRSEVISEDFVDTSLLIYDSTSITFDTPHIFRAEINIFIASQGFHDATLTGFDNILIYPFLLEELRNIIVTSHKKDNEIKSDTQKNEKIILLNRKQGSVIFKNAVINLSDNEICILKLLCKNVGNCVTREELSRALNTLEGNMADVYICHLRRKLEKPFGVKVIYTVRSKGYMTDYSLI